MMDTHIFHEDAFYDYFIPYRHPSATSHCWGNLGLETFGKDSNLVKELPAEYVWTVLDLDDNGHQWTTPGIHWVNRVCYLVTEIPHNWLGVEFRIPRQNSSLTPIGLTRQITRLKRVIADHRS